MDYGENEELGISPPASSDFQSSIWISCVISWIRVPQITKKRAKGFSYRDNTITDEELQEASEKIYHSDHNRAEESDIVLNKQYFTSKTNRQEDNSPNQLFSYVNHEKLFSKPTYASFIKLLDNYNAHVGTEEKFTKEQMKEQDIFLQEIMKTEVMKELYTFLHSKREIKKKKVSGFHNWIRFYLLEKQGIVNYFSHSYDGPWTSYPDVLGMQFDFDGFYKQVGSAFIGSSPEFEFGLYSLCFIARPGKVCHLKIGGHNLDIQTYTWDKSTYVNGKKYIATAYVASS
ncbi:hypothetical protein E2320_016359 [Naja naja]|nr:hypothetical protein E2320_016359 [Naja naja]